MNVFRSRSCVVDGGRGERLMGRAARWLRGLLGEKKSVEGGLLPENRPAKEKKRWGFVKSFRESEKSQQIRGKGSDREERGNYQRDADEQSMRAIAAAEAAVAVAQAAVTVVRIISCSGRSVGFGATVGMKLEEWAAIKIQAVFRGYLARRALRALRGLVKLQALVRGNIVRKQAAETLRCMQALLRVQSRARALRSESSRCGRSNPGPEKYEPAIQSSRSIKQRNPSKQTRMDAIYKNGDHFVDWNWLDQWTEERYGDSREVSKGFDDEKNSKILEVDTEKPPLFISRQSLASMPDLPSKDSTTAKLSIPTPSSSVRMAGQSPSPLGFPIVRPEDFLSSPQLFSATSDPGGLRRGSFTPAKSECSRSVFGGCSDYRNYMANTESSRAKARSQSAPRPRPEYKKSSSMKRLSDHVFSGQLLPPPEAACSGWRSALHFQFAKKKYPGSGRLDRLGMP